MTTQVKETAHSYLPEERTKISSSRDAVKLLHPMIDDIDEIESFHVLVLNRANKVIAHKMVSFGGTSGCIVDPTVVFRFAIAQKSAAGIIVAHNHPSGCITPSAADFSITKKLVEGGKLLEMQVLDHVILTQNREIYYSFADEGTL